MKLKEIQTVLVWKRQRNVVGGKPVNDILFRISSEENKSTHTLTKMTTETGRAINKASKLPTRSKVKFVD